MPRPFMVALLSLILLVNAAPGTFAASRDAAPLAASTPLYQEEWSEDGTYVEEYPVTDEVPAANGWVDENGVWHEAAPAEEPYQLPDYSGFTMPGLAPDAGPVHPSLWNPRP